MKNFVNMMRDIANYMTSLFRNWSMKNFVNMMRDIANYMTSLFRNWSMENFKAMMSDVSMYMRRLWGDCFDLDMYLLVTFMTVFVIALVLIATGN